MKKIRVILVDDEKEAREGLRELLKSEEEVEVVEICSNGLEAIHCMKESRIDLAFLDIQMPLVDGFDVIRSVPKERLPMIVFVTAHDEYSLKAFEVQAIDYLLKPFSNARFHSALHRAIEMIRKDKSAQEMEKMQALSASNEGATGLISVDQDEKLIIKESGRVIFLAHHEIIWIEAYDYYVKVHVSDRFYLVRMPLKKLEEGLPTNFIRIHKSSIVNKQFISEISTRKGEMFIVLQSGDTLKVGRTYKDSVKRLF